MIKDLIEPREADIGGLIVRRSLPVRTARSVGPWVFFDHMGPANFAPGRGLDVIPHPHINLATVTYLFEGEIVHRDSIGSVQTISPGAINLMVAGSGIAHSERTGAELRGSGHRAHGLQLWMGLPEDHEEDPPSFHHHPADSIPGGSSKGVDYRVMIGELLDLVSPVPTLSPTVYAEFDMGEHTSIGVPLQKCEHAIYVVTGEISLFSKTVAAPAMAILKASAEVEIQAIKDSRVVLIGGEPLGQRYMWWNFISSRKDRIEQAMEDWKNGRIGVVPNETEPAPLPESDSFSAMKE